MTAPMALPPQPDALEIWLAGHVWKVSTSAIVHFNVDRAAASTVTVLTHFCALHYPQV